MFVEQLEAQRRFDICKQCVNITTMHFCKQCGCYMKYKVKLKLAECPIRLWKKVE